MPYDSLPDSEELFAKRLLSASVDTDPEIEQEFEGEEAIAVDAFSSNTDATKKAVARDTAKKFSELVEKGLPPQVAANSLKKQLLTVGDRAAALEVLKKNLTNYAFSADVARAAVRAGRMKVLIEALASGDNDGVLAASKQIATDPEVGLTAPASTNIKIEIGNIGEILDTIDVADVIEVKE